MIAIIFEVWPKDGKADRYFDIAAGLKAELAEMDGFISVERFESLMSPGKFLSLSFWRDEAAVPPSRRAGRGARVGVRRLPHPGGRGRARLRHDRARGGPGRQPPGA